MQVFQNPEPGNTRLPYVDLCKGAGIVLIVLGHVFKYSPARVWIYSFHIPLFFFLSGYVVSSRQVETLGKFVARRLKTIVLPYFGFAAMFYPYWVLWERRFRPDGPSIPRLQPLLGMFYGIGGDRWLTFDSPLWFLPCLFSTLLALALKKFRSPWSFAAFLGVSSVAGQVISQHCGTLLLPWSLNIVPTSLAFAGIGYLARRANLFRRWSRVQHLLAAVVALGGSVWLAFLNSPVDVAYLRYGKYPLFYIAALSGIGFLYFGCRAVGRIRALERLGRDSLGIMCVHYPIVHLVMGALSVACRQRADLFRDTVRGAPLTLAFTLALSFSACLLIDRLAPFLIGRHRSSVPA